MFPIYSFFDIIPTWILFHPIGFLSNLESFGSFPSAPDGCSTASSRQGGGRTGLATEVLVKVHGGLPLKMRSQKS